MKFENINGVQHIILEENDKISITTEDSHGDMTVDVERQNYGLNITGSSSLINKISGDGMLEKVFVPPVISSEEIVEECDKWLEMFRKVHDKFRQLVLTDRYRKQNITMNLSFCEFFSFSDKNVKGRKIDLDLVQYGTVIQEGMTIAIDENNETVYKYLLANVLAHYLSVNYAGSTIKNMDLDWNHTLYSNDKKQENSTVPIFCGLTSLYDSNEYANIATSIITNHNLIQSSEQIIGNLKKAIYNQQLSERFNRSIAHSGIQFEYIMSDSDSRKAPVLEKRKKN